MPPDGAIAAACGDFSDATLTAVSGPPLRSIKFWLMSVAVACVLPAWLAAAVLITAAYIREFNMTADATIITAHTLMQLVDREIVMTRATLEALATTRSIAAGDFAAFHARSELALPNSGATVIRLIDPSGVILSDSLRPFGTVPAPVNDTATLRRVVETARPAVTGLFIGPVTGRYFIAVDIPVISDGHVTAVLAAGIPSDHFSEVLSSQNLPKAWYVGIVDTTGTILARTRDPQKFVGQKTTPTLWRQISARAEGVAKVRTIEGVDVLVAFSRSELSGWTLGIGIPRSSLTANLHRTLWLSIAGAAALLLFGVATSFAVGMHIARSVRLLRAPADALATGQPVCMPTVAIAEVAEIGVALVAAAALLAQRAADRENAEAAEQRAETADRQLARLAAVMEATPDPMVKVNRAGQIIRVNHRLETSFGYSRSELLGRSVDMLIAEPLRNRHWDLRKYFFAGRNPPQTVTGPTLFARRKDGSTFPAEVSLSPLLLEGETFVMAAIRDITERKALEAEMEASRAQVVVSARLSALGTMAGGIAHEINNPLAIIHAAADELVEDAAHGSLAPQQVEQAAIRIMRLSDRISRMIRSLRYLARDGSGDPLIDTAMSEIVEQALDVCRQRFHINSIALTVAQIDPDIRVPCREVQISQIVVNLLQNAFDAAMENSSARWVRLEVARRDGLAVLSVVDSGNGVPDSVRDRIMEPFFTTKALGKGTGLGLSLSRQIAEMHGGKVELADAAGHTCFRLWLPLSEQRDET